MIPVPSGARVWLAAGHTDMRRTILGTRRLTRSARTAACRSGRECDASRDRGADGCSREDCGAVVRAAQAGTPRAARTFAARAHRLSGAFGLSMLWRRDAAQDRRGRDRDAGAHSAPVESDPARTREVLLPGLRSDHPAAGTVPSDRAWARRPQAARPYPVRQIRPAPTAQSPERRL